MKTNLNYLTGITLLLASTIFNSCTGNHNTDIKDTTAFSATTATTTVTTNPANGKLDFAQDSIELANLVKGLYKWHITAKKQHDGFKAIKINPTDTLDKAIDLDETEKSVAELKATKLFTDGFLNNYRSIAVRMDKELRDGSSLWPDGELPTFNDDVDEWCDCQDSPIDNYWTIIKLKDLSINNNQAQFKWTWGGDFSYNVKAEKQNGVWAISYLQGFDMKAYNWEYMKKNKGK